MHSFESVTQIEIDQRVYDLYDEYCHGGIDRREFMKSASLIAGGLAMAQALLPNYAGYEAALKAAGVPYEAYIYPGTQHGFHNNSTPRYVEAAAKQSWDRTVAFFRKNLA